MDLQQKTPFQVALEAAVAERMALIMKNRDRLCDAWMAETGLKPSESVLNEVTALMPDGSTHVRVYITRREPG